MNYLKMHELSRNGDLKAAIRIALRNWSRNKIMATQVPGADEMDYLTAWAVDEILRNISRYVDLFVEYAVLQLPDDLMLAILSKDDTDTFEAAITALDSALDVIAETYIPIFAARLAPPKPIAEGSL